MTYIIISTIISLAITYFMPKRLKPQEIYVTWGILAAIGINSDLFLGEIVDLYDFGQPGVQLSDLLVDAIFPPSLGIIYLNYLPSSDYKRLSYMLAWTAASTLIEWLSIIWGFENVSHGWIVLYSVPIYLLVFIFLNWHIKYIRK